MKISTFIGHIRAFFTKKRIIWTIVLLIALLIVWAVFFKKPSTDNIQTALTAKQDVKKTVLTTGQVVSSTDLSLSFQTSGFVRRINVKEGDTVKEGQVLAVLDQGIVGAQLQSAKGTLAQAEVNYIKVSAAATAQDVAVSQAALDAAGVTLENAKQNLLNEIHTAYADANTALLSYTNILFSSPQSLVAPQFSISGTVQTNAQLVSTVNDERIVVNTMLPKWQSEVSLVSEVNRDAAIDSSLKNLLIVSKHLENLINLLTSYTQVTSGGSQTTLSTYQSGVASAKATVDAAYTGLISSRQSVKTAEASYASAKAAFDLKKAPARPEDLASAQAQVFSAQAGVQSAQVAYNNTMIVAPTAGTVTQINIKLGELATASSEAMKLLNIGELHTEAQISEADIASLVVGQSVDMTFDSLGPDRHFEGKILTVNPASTVVSGVVNYKVTGSLENIPEVKPGMTANMTILVTEKKDILVTPSSAIINKDGKKFVRVIKDPKLKTFDEVLVTTGLEADGGLVEIVSGLDVGQEIVTFMK